MVALSSRTKVEAGNFAAAVAAGAFQDCREFLASAELPAAERALLCCRLAEGLYHAGESEEALSCARTAFASESENESVGEFCAWLFSNCGKHDEAAAAYQRLIACRPQWAAGHRHLSGACSLSQNLDRALFHAAMASDLDPSSFEFAIHAGALLADAGRSSQAFLYLRRALSIAPRDLGLLHRLSALLWAEGRAGEAIELALRAQALSPDEPAHARHAAELLLRSGRFEEAVEIVRRAAERHPADDLLLRLLSESEMRRGRFEAALAAIAGAIDLVPGKAEYHLHRGHLLYRLGRFEEAALAFGRASAADPGNAHAKRSQMSAYLDAGRFKEALRAAGALMQSEPENAEHAAAVREVLNRRLNLLDTDFVVYGERPPRPPPPPARWRDALAAQLRVFAALVIREGRTRYAESKLGYSWALIEPMLNILLLFTVFGVIMHGQPPIGRHWFIFYYTGLVPYHMFVHTSSDLAYAISSNAAVLQLPLVTTLDVILARGLLEFITDAAVAVILLGAFTAFGIGAVPHHFIGVALVLGVVWLFGMGCGILNAVINVFFKSWEKIWAQLMRILYFVSGIFYVPMMMPDWARNILVWNPILQAVDWFRVNFFEGYKPYWLDRGGLALLALLTFLLALALERALRPRLYEPP
jgi:ABC-type polysaccharide/polyol phosphate export permease/predicted Zn-dependent protease